MDTPTRVGLGGTALFTLAGVGAPILTWWVSGPIMAACAAVSLWGFWPVVRHPKVHAWPFGRVGIDQAAQEAYEAAEREGALAIMGAGRGDQSYKLETFKTVFMVDDEVILHGAEPPSTQALPIPRDKYKYLRGGQGPNQLNYITPYTQIAYTDVTISRKDLRRIKKEWPEAAKRYAQQFRAP